MTVDGELPPGVTAKDVILTLIAKIGTGGGQGHMVEYRGSAIEALSMEARMTICNMSIEAGARAGMVAPDETTFAYLKGRPHAPQGADWDAALAHWRTLRTEPDADLRPRGRARRGRAHAVRHLGHQPGPGRAAVRAGARPGDDGRPEPARRGRVGAGVHGPAGRDRDAGHRGGHGVPRLLHQRADRGPARRGRGAPRPKVADGVRMLVVPGLHAGQGAGRAGGPATRSSPPPAPSGARPAARCAWA